MVLYLSPRVGDTSAKEIEVSSLKIRKRLWVRLLDEVLGIAIALVGLIATGIPSAIVFWPISQLGQEVLADLAQILVGVLPLSTFIFLYVWATAERARNGGQSVGMSIANTRYVSDKSRLKNKMLRVLYGWVYIGQRETDGWAGDEDDDVSSLLLFKKFFVLFVLFSLTLVVGVILFLFRVPLLILNQLGNSTEVFQVIPMLDYPIFALALLIAISTITGPLLVFTSEGKTLSDHFFGVRMISGEVDQLSPKPKFWIWFWRE